MLPNQTLRIRPIRIVFESHSVLCRESQPLWKTKCADSKTVADLLRSLSVETKEHFVCLHLDSKNNIVCYDPVSIGSLNASVVHPREVFKAVLLSSASSIVMVHNPSGDPQPSSEDQLLTRRMIDAGELLGIRVLDHVIVAADTHYSFADHGLM